MRSKVDANATDVCMGLNNDSKESGETNKNEVHNDQHATVPGKNHFTPGSPNDPSSFSNNTSRSSKSNYKSQAGVTYTGNNIALMTSCPLQKNSNFPREGTKPHVTKPQYEGQDNQHNEHSRGENDIKENPHTESLHGEKDIQVYKDMEEYSNKDKKKR